MASRALASTALVLALNLLFFTSSSSSSSSLVSSSECSKPSSPKKSPPTTPASKYCPIDTLKLGTCANVLGLINLQLGAPPKEPCCSLLEGLADVEAAVCLCTALKANILGININIPIDLSLLVNYCGKSVPTGFQCPP